MAACDGGRRGRLELRSTAFVVIVFVLAASTSRAVEVDDQIVWVGPHVVSGTETYVGEEIIALGPILVLPGAKLSLYDTVLNVQPQIDAETRTSSQFGDEVPPVSIQVMGSGALEVRNSLVTPLPQPRGRWSLVAGDESSILLEGNMFEWLGIGEDERRFERVSASSSDPTRGMLFWTPNVSIRNNTFLHAADAIKTFDGGEIVGNRFVDVKGHGFWITQDLARSGKARPAIVLSNTFDQVNETAILLVADALIYNTQIKSQGLGIGLEVWGGDSMVENLTVEGGSDCIRTLSGATELQGVVLRGCWVGFRAEGGVLEATGVTTEDIVARSAVVAAGVLRLERLASEQGASVSAIATGQLIARNSTLSLARALDSSSIDARWNYWGSASGPTPSQVVGDVTIEPWLETVPE